MLLSSSSLTVVPTFPYTSPKVPLLRSCQRSPASPPSLQRRSSRKFTIRSLHRPSTSLRCSPMPVQEASSLQFHGSLLHSRAYWVSRSLIAWNVDVGSGSCYLYSSETASLVVTGNGIEGHDSEIKFEPESGKLPADIIEKFPHIKDYRAFKVPHGVNVQSLLKCQLAVALFDFDGKCCNATGLQLPGVVDDLFSYTGPLGAVFSAESVSLYLWAPTAQAVSASIYCDPSGGYPLETVQLKEENGVWNADGPRSWEGCYYVYEVSVYHPSTLHVEKCYANDPYARGLSSDARRTFFVNLDHNDLKPEGWDKLADEKPELSSFSDISIYELHIRDFSANYQTVNPEIRGGYLAFTSQDSAGVLHLKKLSNAGLTHVHLLPTFQFAGVADEKEKWKFFDADALAKLPPDSDEQQAQVTAIKDEDGYNWGYNPVLWGVPKGSYASNPNGSCRTLEFRKMVQALNRIGLRVVLDVVYNHLHGNGPHDDNSVLDKIVPGYYLRRNTDGDIENSTCVNNTASEHFMVERLILDDLHSWAVNYKVDGFRLDLMGHLMKSTMVKANNALHSLLKDKNGVDGSKIYIYGEGWDFGEVAKNARGVNASQFNLFGTGIGSFNDRIRDAVLGGSPFAHPLLQGFVTGLSFQPNGHDHGAKSVVDGMLATSQDHIQVGMAANLRDFVLTCHQGEEVKGSEVLTHDGLPIGYASQPIETINYVSAHDNETLFDIISLKTPVKISIDERCRINHLATSIIALSQGIPFFHGGDDTLRSKSLDRDSYNSGDWFNRLDFSYESNNWGVGLPLKEKNEHNWPLIKPRLADPSFKPHKTHILSAVENFVTLLRIRYSSPLFRLRTANAVQALSNGLRLMSKAVIQRSHPLSPNVVLFDYDQIPLLSLNHPFLSIPAILVLDDLKSLAETFISAQLLLFSAIQAVIFTITFVTYGFLQQICHGIQRRQNIFLERVRFHNTGPSRIPGTIVMSIEDGHQGMPGLVQLDPNFSYIVVLFNALPTEVSFMSPALRARNLQLHPLQLRSSDNLVKNSEYEASSGRFTIPPRTTSVFIESRSSKLEKGVTFGKSKSDFFLWWKKIALVLRKAAFSD